MSIEKLDMHSPDLVNENIEKLTALFPNCIIEGADGKSIDFDLLRQELSHAIIEGNKERYRIEWPGKKEAIVTANLPTSKTLRPIREDSVDFDNTENIYIEGDNLEVLKLLQESYLGKIKMIYIDPPYNTGKDFVYKDNFAKDTQEELLESGQKNEYNERLVVNPETAGRYHSDWLSMIYPRLKLSRNLLTKDGVIFISIDDNEIHNLRKVCDEIFGEQNFIAQAVRKRRDSQANLSKNISPIHEYVVFYKKSGDEVLNRVDADINESDYKNPDNDPRGPYVTMPCTNKGGAIYEVTTPTGNIISDEWRFKKETYDKLVAENKLVFPRGGEGKPRYKLFLSEKKEMGVLANTWWDNLASNQEATREIKTLFDNLVFDTPKPLGLLNYCFQLATDKNSIVLDFFAGSCSTSHALMSMNAKDNGSRKYIMVQVPEITDEKSEAFKSGYKNICEIGKERIRRAAKKIKEETKAEIDYGFRVYRLDESNMQDVYYKPQDYTQSSLDLFADNVKADRTSDDLLAQVMLDWGLPLNLKIETKVICGKQVFNVAENSLFACFDKGIDEDFAKELASEKPLRVVFKDNAFKDDTAKTNVKQLLKQLSPNTEMKVI
jgi:adenine-specific DNA-methyltransferase